MVKKFQVIYAKVMLTVQAKVLSVKKVDKSYIFDFAIPSKEKKILSKKPQFASMVFL